MQRRRWRDARRRPNFFSFTFYMRILISIPPWKGRENTELEHENESFKQGRFLFIFPLFYIASRHTSLKRCVDTKYFFCFLSYMVHKTFGTNFVNVKIQLSCKVEKTKKNNKSSRKFYVNFKNQSKLQFIEYSRYYRIKS